MNTGKKLLEKYRTELMGFAALYIFIYHVVTVTFYYAFDAHPFFAYLVRIGFLGVDIFFFLSGDGLMHAMEKESVKAFWLRRLARVYFPFFVGGLLQFFLNGLTPLDFVKRITCIAFYTETIYSLLWFVPAILTIYLLFPLYYKLMSAMKNKTVFILMTIAVWFILEMIFRNAETDLFGFFNRIPIFLMGCLYATAKEDELCLDKWILAILGTVAGMYSLYLAEFKGVTFVLPISDCGIPTFLVAISLPYVLAGIMEKFEAGVVMKGLRKFLAFFGMMSLEFYCLQENMVVLYMVRLTPDVLPGVMLLIIFASCVAGGLALWFVNGRIMKLVRKVK